MFSFFNKDKKADVPTKEVVENKNKYSSLTTHEQDKTSIIQLKSSIEKKKNPIGWTKAKSYEEDSHNLLKEIEKNGKISPISKSVKYKLNVLLVDDSITVRKYVSELLIKNNYDVSSKVDGLHALMFLQNSGTITPDLIISDMEMPQMAGDVFIKNVRKEKRFKSVPILVISSHAERHLELMELELIQGFMHKPFEDAEFIEQIRYLLSY